MSEKKNKGFSILHHLFWFGLSESGRIEAILYNSFCPIFFLSIIYI